jgi:hypothetical protein
MVLAHALQLAKLSDEDRFYVLDYGAWRVTRASRGDALGALGLTAVPVTQHRRGSIEDTQSISKEEMNALKAIRANTSRFLRHQEPLVAATKIQAHVRGWLVRKRIGHVLRGAAMVMFGFKRRRCSR